MAAIKKGSTILFCFRIASDSSKAFMLSLLIGSDPMNLLPFDLTHRLVSALIIFSYKRHSDLHIIKLCCFGKCGNWRRYVFCFLYGKKEQGENGFSGQSLRGHSFASRSILNSASILHSGIHWLRKIWGCKYKPANILLSTKNNYSTVQI